MSHAGCQTTFLSGWLSISGPDLGVHIVLLNAKVHTGLLASSQVFNRVLNLSCFTGEFRTTGFIDFNRFSLIVKLGGFSLLVNPISHGGDHD